MNRLPELRIKSRISNYRYILETHPTMKRDLTNAAKQFGGAIAAHLIITRSVNTINRGIDAGIKTLKNR